MRRGILIVAPFLPWPADFGGAQRIAYLARGLAREHEVTIVAPFTPPERDAVLALGELCDVTAVPVRWSPRQPAGRSRRLAQLAALAGGRSFAERSFPSARLAPVVDRILRTRRIDLVQFEFPQTTCIRLGRAVPTVLDAHNIEHTLLRRVAETASSEGQRIFNLLEWRRVRQLERRAWRGVDLTVATSDVDARAIAGATGRDVPVVPNGVDVARLARLARAPAARPRVVFVGALRHAPNASGVRWYVEQVHPLVRVALPDVELAIVGADPPESIRTLASASIVVTGTVDDVDPWLASAGVAIVPLWSGSGTRLKILEAFAAGVPVVSTTLGAEGLAVTDNRHILLRDTADAFAAAVIALLRGTPPAGFDVEAARALARETYDWDLAVVPRLVAAHDIAIERFAAAGKGVSRG